MLRQSNTVVMIVAIIDLKPYFSDSSNPTSPKISDIMSPGAVAGQSFTTTFI